jgi:hypothetical protein
MRAQAGAQVQWRPAPRRTRRLGAHRGGGRHAQRRGHQRPATTLLAAVLKWRERFIEPLGGIDVAWVHDLGGSSGYRLRRVIAGDGICYRIEVDAGLTDRQALRYVELALARVQLRELVAQCRACRAAGRDGPDPAGDG